MASLNRKTVERGWGGVTGSEWLTPGSPASGITTSALRRQHLSAGLWGFLTTQRFKLQSGPRSTRQTEMRPLAKARVGERSLGQAKTRLLFFCLQKLLLGLLVALLHLTGLEPKQDPVTL